MLSADLTGDIAGDGNVHGGKRAPFDRISHVFPILPISSCNSSDSPRAAIVTRDSAFRKYVATETFVPACTMPGCAGCYHPVSDCPELSMHLRNANDDNVKAAHLAEFVANEMQSAFDEEDDETFAELCEHYGKAEVHKGPTANTFASHAPDGHSLRAQYSGLREISAVKFTVDPALGARSVVFEDSNATAAPPRVELTAEKTKKIVPTVKTTPTIVHNDERALGTFDKWANYVSPVLDMTPTASAHFDKFTLTADPFDETEDEDACETEDDVETAEVVSVPPSRADVEAARLRAWREHAEVGCERKETDVFHDTDVLGGYSYFGKAYDAFNASYKNEDATTTPPQPPPPRQRIGGGRKIGLLQTALLSNLFFCAFVFLTDDCDATAVTAQLAQPLTYAIDYDVATPPAQGLVVSQHDILAYDASTEDFYEDPGPGRSEIENNDDVYFRIRACRALRGEIESEMLYRFPHVVD
ncbi:hypothetical protein CYMTET_14422 [Cymbomonas tetramitiformis]|uniref:Uncharacterized protein n=1 Tax=Cymbomonas tetramitiformis TaxID=36881 RepID=A0AAE0GHJ7_9CHLO|nr:hypothetical protein CYMTET_14422 [Cymbomonas tetramitiformis]